MRVLVACEHSGIVRDAFAKLGHDTWSCDVLPSMRPGNHIQGDVRQVLNDGWDLMIAHPPCRYLSYAGMRYWHQPGRAEKRAEAMALFMELVNAPIHRICIENPRGYPNQAYRKPDQVIHPYYFGDPHLKRTCLWLKNLPLLWWQKDDDLFGKRTMIAKPEPIGVDSATSKYPGKRRHFTDGATRNPLERSRTFPAVAAAMATQWGMSNERVSENLLINWL
jgi:hypothetical protein